MFERSPFECLALGVRYSTEQLKLLRAEAQPVMFPWPVPDPLYWMGNGAYTPLLISRDHGVEPMVIPMFGVVVDPEDSFSYDIPEKIFRLLPSVAIDFQWPSDSYGAGDDPYTTWRRLWDVYPLTISQAASLDSAVEKIWYHPAYDQMWIWAEYHVSGMPPQEFFGVDMNEAPEGLDDDQRARWATAKGEETLRDLEFEVFDDASMSGPGDLVPKPFEFDLSHLPDDLAGIWDALRLGAIQARKRLSGLFPPDEYVLMESIERRTSPWD